MPENTRKHTKLPAPTSVATGTRDTLMTPPPPPSRRVLAVMIANDGGLDSGDGDDENAKNASADTSVMCTFESARTRTSSFPSPIVLAPVLLRVEMVTRPSASPSNDI